jgi:hypothetical protein
MASATQTKSIGRLIGDIERRMHDQQEDLDQLREILGIEGARYDPSEDIQDEERTERHSRRGARLKKDGTPDLRYKETFKETGK